KNQEAREIVREMLEQGVKPELIMKAAGISRATYYRIKNELLIVKSE
ncbi:helix-turn-helix domain-containing protein, partial [Escherichia coli]|nr:helix-turn-helix domain-containing protein [Escherichia coli]